MRWGGDMPNINVAGIKVDFKYTFDTFFKDNIEAYITDEKTMDYTMSSHMVDSIKPIKGKVIAQKRNRTVYKDKNNHIIVNLSNEGFIKEKIIHSIDYKHIEIFISKESKNNHAEIEYVLTGLMFLELALKEKKLALHGAALNVNNNGIIFSAPSGVGKSTHANHWVTNIENVEVINDDKPLLFMNDGVPYVCGSPWSGKSRINKNQTVPLKQIVFLKQGSNNQIYQLSNKRKILYLFRNTIRPRNEQLMEEAITIIDALMKSVDIVEYQLTKDKKSLPTIHQYLIGGTS